MNDYHYMPLLQQALNLFDKPVTLDSIIEWEQLAKKARGEEADYIGELYEGLFNQLDEQEYQRWEAWTNSKIEKQ